MFGPCAKQIQCLFGQNPLEPVLITPCDLTAAVHNVPVGLPNVYRLWVGDAVLSRLVVQQVEEVFDSKRDRTTGAEDDREQVIHKLLQRPLENMEEEEEEEGGQNDLMHRGCSLCHNVFVTGNKWNVPSTCSR